MDSSALAVRDQGTPKDQGAPNPRGRRVATDYSMVMRAVQDLGLMKRRIGYYCVKLTALLAALGCVWLGFALLGGHWAQAAIAAALGLVLTQVLFLSHDAAHRQIFRSNRANEVTALLLGTLLGGVSLTWWNNKHNRHHAAPNQIGKDPDIKPSVIHMYPVAQTTRTAVGRSLRRLQGWWFFPLLAAEALNLHIQSVRTLLSTPGVKHRRLELTLLTIRLGGYPTVLFLILTPGLAVSFLAIQLVVSGLYLGSAFAASHIGMPIVPKDARIDFFRRQVLQSRNVSGGRLASFAMGGLNYQIEHHLFPSMPRPNLRRARTVVRAFCRDHGISYDEVNILRAWRIVATHLNEVGLAARHSFSCPTADALRQLPGISGRSS